MGYSLLSFTSVSTSLTLLVYEAGRGLYYQTSVDPHSYEFMNGAVNFGSDVDEFKIYIQKVVASRPVSL